jgi:hypothetical protein
LAGKIIADIIEAPYDSIRMNVANVTVLTANNSGLTYLPTGNVNINVGSTASLSLGNVTVSNLITANGGIAFPATQVSSANANTLDDYEEGTWTPIISLAVTSPTYSKQEGKYTKIGNVVTVSCTLAISAGTTDGSTFRVGGFPFSAANLTDRAFVNIVLANNLSSNGVGLFVFMNNNATTAFLNVQSATASGALTGNQYGTSGSISFSLTYIVA